MSMNPDEGPAGQGTPIYPPPPAPEHTAPSTGLSFDFQGLFQQWKAVLTTPSVSTFDAQQPSANWSTVLIALALHGVALAIFGYPSRPGLGPFVENFIAPYISFFILTAIFFAVARMFGGTGTFLTYAFLLSLASVPLGIVIAIAGIVPVVGSIVAFAASIYGIWLTILATASAHRLTMGKAAATVLIPLGVLLVIVLILAAVAAAILVALGLSFPH